MYMLDSQLLVQAKQHQQSLQAILYGKTFWTIAQLLKSYRRLRLSLDRSHNHHVTRLLLEAKQTYNTSMMKLQAPRQTVQLLLQVFQALHQ